MSDHPSKSDFLNSLGIPYPSNEGASDSRRYDGEAGVALATVVREVQNALAALKHTDPDQTRNIWADTLLQKMIPSNPYREPLDERGAYADICFLESLKGRVDRLLEEYYKAWARYPRSFDETGHF